MLDRGYADFRELYFYVVGRIEGVVTNTAPAWLTMPCPSAVTSNCGCVLVACTCRVTLLSGDEVVKQSHPPWSGGSSATGCRSAHRPRKIPRLASDQGDRCLWDEGLSSAVKRAVLRNAVADDGGEGRLTGSPCASIRASPGNSDIVGVGR